MDEYKRRRRRSRAVMSMFLDSLGGSIDNVDVATFDSDGTDLKALIVGIEPVQSGTGDPTPDNVRPITGHSSVNVIVSPTLNPLDGTITNIPLGQTVYGGTLDVITGVLTVDWAMLTLDGTQALAPNGVTSASSHFIYTVSGKAVGNSNILSNRFYNPSTFIESVGIMYGRLANSSVEFFLPLDVAQTTAAGRQWFVDNPTQLCYELAAPTTVQLTGQQIATFLGTNNVWCDSGKIIHLEY